MQRLRYSSNESSDSSEVQDPASESRPKFEEGSPQRKTKSILVLPKNRKFGNLVSASQKEFNDQPPLVLKKKTVSFNKEVFIKKSSISSSTRKKMVIQNPSGMMDIPNNELGVAFKSNIVLVSPRIVVSDESKSPPTLKEEKINSGSSEGEKEAEKLNTPFTDQAGSILSGFVHGQQSNTDFKTNKSDFTQLKEYRENSREGNLMFSPDAPKQRRKKRKPTGYVKKKLDSNS
jgi:hypothetical protein